MILDRGLRAEPRRAESAGEQQTHHTLAVTGPGCKQFEQPIVIDG